MRSVDISFQLCRPEHENIQNCSKLASRIFLYEAGTVFIGVGGDMSPQLLVRGYVISFVPRNIL